MTEIQKKLYYSEGDPPEGYQKTPIGFLPIDWGYAKIGDLSVELKETAGQKEYETVSISAGIGFVNQAKKFGKELSGKQYEKYIVLHKGDFSYNKGNSNRYPQGCIYRLNDREEAAVPNVFESFRIVKGCPEYYEQLFISGFLNHQLDRLINHGVRDDGLLNLTGTDFYSCLLPVPSLWEQERIVDILSACSSMIEKYEEKAEQFRKLKKNLLAKMFPKKGATVPEIRFPGFTGLWEQRKLCELLSFQNGFNGSSESFGSGIPLISVLDILNKDFITYDSIKGKACLNIDEQNRFLVEYGDILFQRSSENREDAGASNVYLGSDKTACFGGFVIRGKKISDYDPIFMKYDLCSTPVRYQIISKAQGAQHINVSQDTLSDVIVNLPALKEQKAVGSVIWKLDTLITLHQRGAEAWKTKKKALAQLLLTGIVRV